MPLPLSLLTFLLISLTTVAGQPLNILFITSDDMNYDSTGVCGGPIKDLTPNIDQLATQGLRFDYAHYTNVRRLDDAVGSILEVLDQEGFAENTIVVFYGSDHGMSFPFAKSNDYENSTRGSLIVRWPGVVEPGTVDREHLVSTLDFTPTFLDAAGLPQIPDIDGRSFLKLLKGEFYDMTNDRNERVNLIDDPKYQSEIESMRQELLALMKRTGDPFTEALADRKNPAAAARAIQQMMKEYGGQKD